MGIERGRGIRRRLLAAGVAAAAALPVAVPAAAGASPDEPAGDDATTAAASYRMTDLGTGYDYDSRSLGFGPNGLIAGWVTVGFENRTAIWRAGNPHAEVIGPVYSSPLAISSRGEVFSQVIGDPPGTSWVVRWWRGDETRVAEGTAWAALADDRGRVLLQTYGLQGRDVRIVDGRRSRVVTGLPDPLPPVPPSRTPREPYLTDLSDRGEIVGVMDRDDTADDAFIWRDGVTTYLPALPDAGPPPGGGAGAYGIDDRGVIVGMSTAAGGAATHPVLWRGGRVVDLGVPPGFVSCFVADWSGPLTSGWIVGSCYRTASYDVPQPFVWHRGTYTVLPTISGSGAIALEVNARGLVAGVADSHAVAWDGGTIVDLGTLGGTTSAPTDIDERGRVLGDAELPDGRTHAVLWTPRR